MNEILTRVSVAYLGNISIKALKKGTPGRLVYHSFARINVVHLKNLLVVKLNQERPCRLSNMLQFIEAKEETSRF